MYEALLGEDTTKVAEMKLCDTVLSGGSLKQAVGS